MEWETLLGLAQTQTWGDFGATLQRKIAVERVRITPTKDGSIYGRATASRLEHRSVLEGLDYTFEWQQWVSYHNIAEVLYFALGDETVTGSDPYSHTFSTEVGGRPLPTFALFVDQGIGSSPTLNFSGCKIDELRLENTNANILRATVRGQAKTYQRVAALTVTSEDDDQFGLSPFVFSDLIFSQGLNGAVRAVDRDIEELTFTFRNNLVRKIPSSDSTVVMEPAEGLFTASGSFRMEMEDWAEFNAFIADQQLDISAVWTSGAYSLTVTVANAVITAHPLPEGRGGGGRSLVSVDFRGMYDESDSVEVVLVTDVPGLEYESSSSSSQSSSSSSSSSNSSSSSSSSSSSESSSSSSSQ